ncbi:RNA polymerase sigma factor [Flavobacterium algicola]|uniref:RNA polymerase sigma factor n=1 Tax=Flavobacterium algicola TaxID=556529 RepID=UPI001EFC97CB|nr:sigma-70 family RNA polymerase sigma factor [Flavobacterium algicola]MCG9793535.1 sigma-70 family RNA polymerase sigma factor [Flavobacterium algicola]
MNNKSKKIFSDAISDDYLLQQIRNDDYKSMELFFKRYYEKLCRFGLSYETNSCLVEEKVADIFIELWKNRKSLDKVNNPKSYIYVIAKNRLRKVDKFEYFHQTLDEHQIGRTVSFPSREDEIIDDEKKESSSKLIRAILNDIPKKSRQAFELSRIDGLKYKEIAEILNISPKTVENHIALTMRLISEALSLLKIKKILNEHN